VFVYHKLGEKYHKDCDCNLKPFLKEKAKKLAVGRKRQHRSSKI